MTVKQIKQCKCCRKAFVPQYTDAEMKELYRMHDEEMYPPFFMMGSAPVPTQEICEKCLMNPNLEVTQGVFYEPSYKIKKKDA